MYEDPILAELDKIRAEILAEFDGDFDAYLDHLDMVEAENRKRGFAMQIRQHPKRRLHGRMRHEFGAASLS